MDDAHAWAVAYLGAQGRVPWLWADDGDVLVWKDGTTVAFRQEIIQVLEWLVPHGWPPFGALVWLFAACRGKLPPAFPMPARPMLTANAFPDTLREMHVAIELGLLAISQLPADLRSSWKAKATLAEMVFSETARETAEPKILNAVLDIFQSGALTDTMLNSGPAAPTTANGEWRILYQGLSRLTPESIRLRLQTGLDAVPQPAPLTLPPGSQVRQVLEELRADSEHAGFVRLVRDFMAAIQLPRRLSEQDEMPVGGFADITNRGNPDRLLLSELAHDDLTLAVRIALNEALYLRREPPAKPPPSTLTILLDSGVRTWGVPRALIAAAALAFVARSEAPTPCTVFRARGAELQPVDLLSKAGVVAHLGVLEPDAHPGPALAAFRARLAEVERPEVVLITQRDVFADPDFQRDLALAGFENLYLALVDRDGAFSLLRFPHGATPLCEARLDIDDLLPPAPGAKPAPSLLDRAAHPELPLILSHRPFPFLIPVSGQMQKMIPLRAGGAAGVLRDGRLLTWESSQKGAQTVASELPFGTTLELAEHDDGALGVVKSCNGRRLTCRVFSREGRLMHAHDWQFPESVRRVESRSDLIFLIHRHHAEVRDMVSGASLATLPVTCAGSHGRYFYSEEKGWCALSWNGQALKLVPLVNLLHAQPRDVLRVFQRTNVPGPWVLLRNGTIQSPDGGCVMNLGPLQPPVHVSEDGHGLIVVGTDYARQLVNLHNKTHFPFHGSVTKVDEVFQPAPPRWSVRHKLRAVALTRNGFVCVQTFPGQWLGIQLMPNRQLALRPMGTLPVDDAQSFEPMKLPKHPGYSLKIARWPDGRRAWLDSRGLLHLRFTNPSLPEISIVLCDDPVLPIWTTNGHARGGPFFRGDHPSSSVVVLWNLLRSFTDPS